MSVCLFIFIPFTKFQYLKKDFKNFLFLEIKSLVQNELRRKET